MTTDSRPLRHGLSFDVECYYQIVAKDYFAEDRPPTLEVARNTAYLLDELARFDTRATFFLLGNVARKYPTLVKRIADEGHELGVHGDAHEYVGDLEPASFREHLQRAKDSIEQAASAAVVGHRAAAFSISQKTMWATDILLALGLRYDSSIFPVSTRRYGVDDSPLGIHRLPNGLLEIPLTVVNMGQRRVPAAGGGYFRIFPYVYTRWAMAQLEAQERPAITYFHPHEFELSRPRVGWNRWQHSPTRALRLARFNAIQGVGRGRRMRHKLAELLRCYSFVPLGELPIDDGPRPTR